LALAQAVHGFYRMNRSIRKLELGWKYRKWLWKYRGFLWRRRKILRMAARIA